MAVKKRIIYLATATVLVITILLIIFCVHYILELKQKLILDDSLKYYISAELIDSDHSSRRWMNFAIELQKTKNFDPVSASRAYAYLAGTYADTLKIADENQASLAAAEILKKIFIGQEEKIETFLNNELSGIKVDKSADTDKVVTQYLERLTNDGFEIIFDESSVPTNKDVWYFRSARRDGGAASGQWKEWILNEAEVPQPPQPPSVNSMVGELEVQKVLFATQQREMMDFAIISLWHGSTGFIKGSKGDNITPAGVWQNILFSEVAKEVDNQTYATAQKILAQSIADSFIRTWEVKYTHFYPRPSMRDSNIRLALADPPFPGYVSGHSTISKTAAVVLSSIFPSKTDIWHKNANNARQSRLLAGIHFDVDNQRGEEFGKLIGESIVNKLNQEENFIKSQYSPEDYKIVSLIKLLTLKVFNYIERKNFQELWKQRKSLFSNIKFERVEDEAGLKSYGSGYVVWFDYNKDEYLDVLINTGLFSNNGDGTFSNVTDKAFPPNTVGTPEIKPYTAYAGDFNNDTCVDVILLERDIHDLKYFQSACDGTFNDFTSQSGLKITNPRGVSAADYDNDSDLDLYIGNFLPSNGTTTSSESNALWKNNGDGTFVNATIESRTDGLPLCSNYPVDKYELSRSKDTFQPIWFDIDNDFDLDLFVATDIWISPLYRNDNGVFTDITESSGLCVPGTGMGVTIADIDGNNFFDLYVTNTGKDYLWMNQGNETFLEESEKRGVGDIGQGWGTHFTDFDNDGDADLYVVNSNEQDDVPYNEVETFDPGNSDSVYENMGSGNFKEITLLSGISGTTEKRASAVADYNNDGLMDIYVMSNINPNGTHDSLYKNVSRTKNSWISLRLRGTESNYEGIGARIKVTTKDAEYQSIAGVGVSFYANDSRWPHFGLGDVDIIEQITIIWPSGKLQKLKNVPVNQLLTIDEPKE